MPFDLILKGGRVIDPSQNIDRVTDVAFSGGNIVNRLPVPTCRLSTCALNSWSGTASARTETGWPTRILLSCVSLKLATTQTSDGTSEKRVWPG